MKISIVTVVRNNHQIAGALDSILAQATEHQVELVVIDGASTDGTREILEGYRHRLGYFVSEPDGGIYDAMNKGIAAATGDVVGTLNADDLYADDQVLERVGQVFKDKDIECVFGDLVYVDSMDTSRVIRYWKTSTFQAGAFSKGWMPPHPTFFVKKKVYEAHGVFDLQYPLAADGELMMRFLERKQISTSYLPYLMVRMRVGGATNRNLGNIIKMNIELWKAFKNNHIPVNPLYFIRKAYLRGKQYFIRPLPRKT